ncbi:response regulator [Desulfovibrio inopinatus]|uniref:response regulator n=1 Tax=Desulfovibrio inopinatus TaxID=102109 RepID=UPI000686C7F0|nr:response regulator [Desulfovibrio inopinatus]
MGKKIILIVDDDETTRELLSLMAEKAGYSTLLASDGNEGLRLLAENAVDVLLFDIFMPEKDGIQFLIELKQKGYPCKTIAISGGAYFGSGVDYLKYAQAFGADQVIVKPVSQEKLLQALHSFEESNKSVDIPSL